MNVSIIIPAHNAAETLAETLDSLCRQIYPNWEAIVVDDGSSDDTAAIAASFATQDIRIRTVSQPQMGVSAARNSGINQARFDWLLFLDADDWLLPQHLERLTSTLKNDPDLDAAYCGWVRVASDGTLLDVQYLVKSGDLFAEFARACAFAIHTCIVRRSLVEAVGGFDPTLRICEDWDMWQRVARTGASFGAIDEVLALYRVRPDSASVDGLRLFTDGLHVVNRGHSSDPRVLNAHPRHLNGQPADRLPSVKLYLVCWAAGLMLGCGQRAQHLLDVLNDEHDFALDPNGVAETIFEAVPLGAGQLPYVWVELWPTLKQNLDEFLLALQDQAQATNLARRTCRILERMILERVQNPRPLTIGATHAVRIEVTKPIPNIHPPASVERLRCAIELEGERIGALELPVCNGLVPGYVLADAIAAEFSWSILGRFFEHTIYRDLCIKWQPEGLSVWRDKTHLITKMFKDKRPFWAQLHDEVGWTIFLQEVWGHPDWSHKVFYNPQTLEETHPRRRIEDEWLVIEVGEQLPTVELVDCQTLNVLLTVGGVALGVVPVPVKQNIVSAHELLVTLTVESGFELCCAVVREALIGKPLTGTESLRARLVAASVQHTENGSTIETVTNLMPRNAVQPSWAYVLNQTLPSGGPGLILGRREPEAIETSASRRATLPIAAVDALLNVASVANQPAIYYPQPNNQPEQIIYAPDLILYPWRQYKLASTTNIEGVNTAQPANPVEDTQDYFETLFTMQPDPWRYTNLYEQTKYKQTLAMMPSCAITRALELGCAEGHFTVQLAPHVDYLVAADIAPTALKRATKRCADLENVSFVNLDLFTDPLPGRFDLIVCSEVLYFLKDKDALQVVAHNLADALEPGGYLLTAHAYAAVDEPDQPGFGWDVAFGGKVIGETLANTSLLRLVKEVRTLLYRIQLFQRHSRLRLPFLRRSPEIIELEQPTPLPPEVAVQVVWPGEAKISVSDRVPILMYHRIAPTGSPMTDRFRVTPVAFEEQLRYLHAAGFYSIRLEEWQTAMKLKTPLPGRAIHITFDDGYRDFLEYAWPLLKRYGFSATVFLVTDEIGRSNQWDYAYDEKIPLLGWSEIRQLQAEGVEFGSHSASHPHLTALSPQRIVYEGAHSRAILERELEVPCRTFAYPYGDVDPVVQHLIGACGYTFGLSCQPDLSRFQDKLLALPRIEVTGSDSLPDFAAKLNHNI